MNKIRNVFIGSFIGGMCTCMFPNKVTIYFNHVRYHNIPIPLVGGCIGVAGIITSPVLITNYLGNGLFFDKLIDKYDITVTRYHQYNITRSKYGYPSTFMVYISVKQNKCGKYD
jgi:hypothetical protein